MKWTFKDKKDVVQTYLKTGKYPILDKTGRRSSCRRAAYWVKLYKLHGEEGLKHVTKTYTARDRIKAVRLVIKGDSIMTVATTLGLSTSIVVLFVKSIKNLTDGAVTIKSILYSRLILSWMISICNKPKKPHLTPKPSDCDVSYS